MPHKMAIIYSEASRPDFLTQVSEAYVLYQSNLNMQPHSQRIESTSSAISVSPPGD